MRHLTIPFRILLAIMLVFYKTLTFAIGVIAMFVWYLDLKFLKEWYVIMYSNFLEIDYKFERYITIYSTASDFIFNKKTILKKS